MSFTIGNRLGMVGAVVASVGIVAAATGIMAAHAETPQVNDEIHSSFGDTDTQMTVYWHGPDSQINYGHTTAYEQSVLATQSSTKPVDSAGLFWQAKLTGLTPGTTYHYQVGLGGEDHTFQTPPTGDFVWDDIGDTGTTFYDPAAEAACNKPWMADVWKQVAADTPAFVTHGGDISYANECGQGAVHQFWNDIAPIAATAAIQFAWGNHEYGAAPSTAPPGTPRDSIENYKGRFTMPNPQTVPVDTASRTSNPGCPTPGKTGVNSCQGNDWGYFTAGHALFIAYPEPWYSAYGDWQTKADALMANAQADPSIYFIVTYGHRPAYTSLNATAAPAALTTAINALGDKYSPSARPDGKYILNVGHHIHGAEVFAPKHGVVNVTNGGGGTELTSIKTLSPGSLWKSDHFEHLRTTVTDNSMKLEFVCGPAFALNTAKDPCTQGSVIYSTTLKGYKAGPLQPQLSIDITDNVTNPKVGDQLTYVATAHNTQSDTTTSGTMISVTLPDNVAIVDTHNGLISGNTVSWTMGNIEGGGSASASVVTQLISGQPGTNVVVNAQASSGIDCQNPGSSCTASDIDVIASSVINQPKQYITNQSVETDMIGWTGNYSSATSISRVTNDGYDGTASLQIKNKTTASANVGVNPKTRWVTDTKAGTTYTASVWVKSQTAGQKITLQLKEVLANGTKGKQNQVTITTPDTGWHQLTVSYAPAADHSSLMYIVYGSNVDAGSWLHTDMMSLTSPN